MQPKVSIIVPVYNVEEYLQECVDSLRRQTLHEIEIILVDDGSTDNSGKMLDEYANADNRIIVVHKQNGGQSTARNFGFSKSTGEYVLYVDSDDFIVTDTCEVLYKAAEENNADIVQGDLLNDKDKIEHSEYRKQPHDNQVISINEFLKEKIVTQTYDIVPFLYFVKRTYLKKNQMRFEEGRIYEDQLYTLQLLSANEGTAVKIRFPFYYYRMNRPGSTTAFVRSKNGVDAAYICNKMRKYIIENGNTEYMNAVLLISMYQYVSVWLRLKRADRKNVETLLEDAQIWKQIQNVEVYSDLQILISKYMNNRSWFSLNWDIKRFLRKIFRRS